MESVKLKDVLAKISDYNLFNYLLPGTLYALFSKTFTNYNIIQDNLLLGLVLYYFVGMVISRIGSLVIEPLFKLIRFVKYSNYRDYVTASKLDTKIELLSEVNNTYRSLLSMIVVILVMKFYGYLEWKFSVLKENSALVLLISLLIIFALSYRKQTKYVRDRVAANQTNII